MIVLDELHKWLEIHAHLRDWPSLKNAKAAVESKIAEIEAGLAPKNGPKAVPVAEAKGKRVEVDYAHDEGGDPGVPTNDKTEPPEVDRRI